MKKKITIIIFVLIIYLIYQELTIYQETLEINNYLSNTDIAHLESDDVMMVLEIPTLNLQKPIYKFNSSKNNVDTNIQIIKESTLFHNEESNIVLAAHSGNSPISYFEELKKLEYGSDIYLYYQGKRYEYELNKKSQIPKTGYLSEINTPYKKITLVTCNENQEFHDIYYASLVNISSY